MLSVASIVEHLYVVHLYEGLPPRADICRDTLEHLFDSTRVPPYALEQTTADHEALTRTLAGGRVGGHRTAQHRTKESGMAQLVREVIGDV